MKKNAKIVSLFFTLIGLFLSYNAYAEENRITGPVHPAARCSKAFAGEECENRRIKDYNTGCITYDELNSLRNYAAYPICVENDLLAWCPCGCFDSSTRIFGVNLNNKEAKYYNILEIVGNTSNYNVVTLNLGSTLSNLKTKSSAIKKVTAGPEEMPLITFNTANGQKLSVTQEHAILLSDGRMVAAKDVKNSDHLVQADGKPVAISSIESKKVKDDVINIQTEGKTSIEHTLFAEGLIVGDLMWQNNLKSLLNDIAIRK